MLSPINAIVRKEKRGINPILNILCSPTHERTCSNITKTNHEFYSFYTKGLKPWVDTYAGTPKNYHLLPENYIPANVEWDLVLIQQKFGQYQSLYPLAKQLHLPTIVIEHTDVMPWWSKKQVEDMKKMSGDINLFITNYSRERWGWEPNEAELIPHGIDCELFCPDENERKQSVMTVCNDWRNRDYICGYSTWKEVTQGLPTTVVGDNPGLSEPAKNPEHLASIYRSCSVYGNFTLLSPISTACLEAAASACAIVSTNNCETPYIFTHGKDAFLSNDNKELKEYIKLLLNDKELARKMGLAARQTILEKFSLPVFIGRWNDIFHRAANLVYKG